MKQFYFLALLLLSAFFANAQTVTKTSNPSTSTSIDGCGSYCVAVPNALTFTQSDFSQGCQITDVNVTVRWAKTSGTCSAPLTDNSYHSETNFRVDAPSGGNVVLIQPGTYTGTATMSAITQVFDQAAGSVPGGATPVGGTFRPNNGNLNNFNGASGLGIWTLRAGDTGGGDPLCIDYYSVQVSTAPDNTVPTWSSALQQNITLPANNGCSRNVTYSVPQAQDLCGISSITRLAGPASGASFGLGATTVTYRARDIYGNQIFHSFQVTITDGQAPVVTCPGNITVPGVCGGTPVTYNAVTASDLCAGSLTPVLQTSNYPSGANFPNGTTTVTWNATDPSNNTGSCSFTVNVQSVSAPVINCPTGPITAQSSPSNCSAFVSYAVTATDACSAIPVTGSAGANGDNFNVGTHNLTFSATNGGNTVSCSFDVIVEDNTLPVLTCPSSQNISTNAGECVATATFAAATASDNCAVGSIFQSGGPNSGTDFTVGTTTIEYSATDVNANTNTCQFTITVTDGENPAVICPTPTVIYNAGSCGATVTWSTPAYTDNCTMPSNPLSRTDNIPLSSGNQFQPGPYTISYEVVDAEGNADDCSFSFTVADNEDPSWDPCPSAITVSSDAGQCSAVVNFTIDAEDNCTANPTITLVSALGNGSTFPVGTSPVEYSVVDAAGNSPANCSFTVTVEDNELPTVTCPASQTTTFVNCEYTLTDYTPSAGVDNCAGVTVTQSPLPGVITEATTIQLTATDANSNTASCSFTISPLDNTPPTFNPCPTGPVSISANNSCQIFMPNYATLPVADVCNPTLTVTQLPVAGTPLSGTTSVTVTVSDGTNSTDCVFDVTPVDNTNPTITCPGDDVAFTSAGCVISLIDYTGDAITGDNCPGSVTVTQSPVAGSYSGTQMVTLTATDGSSNTATCMFEVEAVDNTPPSISCPVSTTVNYNASCLYSMQDLTNLATVGLDDCPGVVSVTQTPVVGTSIGSNATVVLTATDVSGNAASCSLSLLIDDVTPPTLVCPSDQTVSVDATCDISLADYTGLATAIDNCPSLNTVTISQSPVATTVYDLTTDPVVTVTLTATDGTNPVTCDFDVILQDNIAPVLSCPTPNPVTANVDCEFSLTAFAPASATDNCDASLTFSQFPAQSTLVSGNTLVTLYGEDDAGNIGSCTFTLVVQDGTNPTITCPANQTQIVNASCQFELDAYGFMATTDDNCDPSVVVTQSPAVGDIRSANTLVTLTATDDAGNTANCTFTVNQSDITTPAITCPPNASVNVDANCEYSLGNYVGSGSTSDNCGVISITQSPASSTTQSGTTVVTLTSADAAGNQASCTFNVLPVDNIAPAVTCPGNQTLSSALVGGNCDYFIIDATGLVSGTDNCDSDLTVTQSPMAGVQVVANTTMTMTVEDDNGNTASCTFDFVLNDNVNPSISCPGDFSVSADASCAYVVDDYTSLAVAADNCNASPAVAQGASPAIGTPLSVGDSETITLTATDDDLNTSSCTFNITVEDNTLPVLTCPSTQTVSSSSNCLAFLADYTSSGSVTDCNAASPTITQIPVAGTVIGVTTTVTLTTEDDNGNLGECTFLVQLEDQSIPTIVCPPNQTFGTDASCGYSLADYTALATASDNCDTDVAVTQNPVATSPVSGNTLVTLTGTDDSGLTASCQFTVIATDVIAPIITVCPGDDLVSVAANCTHIVGNYTGDVVYTDNCLSASVSQSPLAGSLIGGNTAVTLTVTDQAGNSEDCTFMIIPEDDDAPTIFGCPGDIVQSNDAGLCGAVVTFGPITAIDNCAGVLVPQLTSGLASGSIFDEGTTTVVYTADDGNGNTTPCQFDVTVNDTEDPVVLCPANIDVNIDASTCGAAVTYSAPTVTDNCPSPGAATQDVGLASGAVFPIGPTVNTYSALDANGNSSSCSFTVTVTDDENPSIICPPNATVSNDPGNCNAIVATGVPTVSDNCPGVVGPTLVAGGADGTVFVFGTTTVTYSVVDAAGNMNDCTFSVTVNDTENPVLTCPADTNINCDAVVVYDLPTVADNCATGLVAVETSPAGGGFVLGANLVEFEAADGNGNTGTCSFTVTVIDTVAPVITCPANQVASFDASCELAAPDYTGLATSTDNCDASPVITQSPTAGSTITGTATITLTSEDISGNTSSCTFDVIDNTSPTITCPSNVVVGSDINCQFTLLDYTATTTSDDNCGGVVLTQSPTAGTLINGLTTVTVFAEDDFGNTNSCTFTVDLIDNIVPSISCIGNQTVQFDGSCMHELIDYTGSIGTSDNCDPSVTVTQDPIATSVISGATMVTMTATDDNSNAVTCTFMVSPVDNIAPTITCPATQTVDFDANCEFVLADYTADGATNDNCSAVTVTQSPAIASAQAANTVVTLTAEDASGNTASCAFVVIPEDNIDPVITCPVDIDVDFDANCEYMLTDYTALGTSTDNCSSVFSVLQSPSVGQTVSSSTVITLTANDGNGNTSTCTFSVNPSDNTAPSIDCIADQIVSFDENCVFEIGDYVGSATTDDNCSGSITVSQSPALGTFISGATEIILTADDGNGNSADCSFMLLPEDDTNPTIACPPSLDVQFGSQGCSYLMSDLTSLITADDNCATVVTITQVPTIGTVVTDTLAVTFTADDGNGNTASCSFDVNPSDQTEPTAVCPGDQLVDFNENCAFEIPDYKSDVLDSDNCGATNIVQFPAEGTLITGPTEVMITVDDGNGNSTDCSFMVTPQDNTVPTLSCPNSTTDALDENCQFVLLDYSGAATVEDNCSSSLVVNQFPPVGTVITTTQVITLSVTDDAGNEAECSFALAVVDTTPPVVQVCPDNQLASLDANCDLLMPDYSGLISATDNCDVSPTISQLPLAGSAVAGVGSFQVALNATDAAGNFTVCEFEIVVSDDTDPTVDCPEDQIIELNANCQFEIPDYTSLAVGEDACGSVSLTQSPLAGALVTTQLNATIIVEDENGNTASCTFFVDIVEMSATVTGTNSTCQGGSNGTATVTVVGGTAPYTEDWGGFNPAALTAGTYAVSIADANGCSTTASVTIEDGPLFEIEIDPTGDVVICEGAQVSLDAGDNYAAYNWSTGASVQTISVSNEASYWVTVTSVDGCLSNTDTVNVMFYNDPIPTVISTTDGIISSSNDTASSYQWYLNGAPIVDATNSYYCPRGSGNYYVVITDANGCTVSSAISEYTYDDNSPCATGIEEYGLTLDVFPNPSDGLFTVNYSLETQSDMKLTVFDLMGQQITDNVLISSQNGTTVIDLTNQADGIYSLRIELEDDKVLQQRLVLVK